jgi:hypothetical protein
MLSDSCHEFLSTIGAAAVRLQAAVEHYAEPPFCYRTEDISNMRAACEAVVSTVSDAPWNPDAMLALVSAAYLTLKCCDAPPPDE